MEIAKANPVPELHTMLKSEEKIDEFMNKFPKNKSYIKKQIQCLPSLSMTVRCLIGHEEVNEFSTEDRPAFEIKVKKNNKTNGYVTTKDHNFLHDEYFHVLFTLSSSILMSQTFKFTKNDPEATFLFGFHSPEAKELTLKVSIVPYCYPKNMELSLTKQVNVYEPPENVFLFL